MPNPKVSAIIPVYNKAETLPRLFACLEKNQQASGGSLEAIFVDDGSHDDSLALITQWAATKSWVVVHHQNNQGAGAARNAAAALSNTPLLAFLDADDVWDAMHIPTLLTQSSLHPEAWLYSAPFERYIDAAPYQPLLFQVPDYGPVPNHFLSTAWGQMYCATSGAAMWKDKFDAIGGFDIRLRNGQDRALWAEAALRGTIHRTGLKTITWWTNTNNSLKQQAFTNTGMKYEHWLQERLDIIDTDTSHQPKPPLCVLAQMREALARDLERIGHNLLARGQQEAGKSYQNWLISLGRVDLALTLDTVQPGDPDRTVLCGRPR